MKEKVGLLLFLQLSSFFCNGQQSCTGPVNSNLIATINGPCSASTSPVIATIGATLHYQCSFALNQIHIAYWNISSFGLIYKFANQSSNVLAQFDSGDISISITLLSQYIQDILYVSCGLCSITDACIPPQLFVVSDPVQIITFGKPK